MIVVMLVVIGCEQTKRKARLSWKDKRREIIDSLATCQSLQDSILCLNGFAYRDALHGPSLANANNMFSHSEQDKFNAETWYSYFLADSLTVYCGGNANFNSALFQEFMPERVVVHGFSIGMSDESTEGHYINLLYIPDPENDKVFLVDPMFNSAYVDNNGNLIDLRTMIYLARKSRTNLYTIKAKLEPGQYMQKSSFFDSNSAIYDVRYCHKILLSNNDEYHYIVSCPRTLDNYLDTKFAETYKRIARFYRYNLEFSDPADFNYCVLFIRNVYGPYSAEIKRVLRYFQNADLAELDLIFQQRD